MKFQEIKIRETIEGPTFQISLEETYACASQITKTDYFFLGGKGGGKGGSSSMKKCNQDFDQALIKKGGDLHSIHTVVS